MAQGSLISVADRIAGALYGTALGDAMGMPMEMFTQQKIRDDFGWPDKLLPGAPDNPISRLMRAGEVTDDTIMTFLTCEMLYESRGNVDARLLIGKIRAWAASDEKSRCVIGPSTRAAFDKIDSGVPLQEAGRAGATNGAAMKAAPIGLVTPPDMTATLLDRAHNLCMPTHNTNAAISGAMAIAGAVSLAVSDADSRSGDLDAALDFALVCANMGATRGYDVLSPNVEARIRLVREKIYGFSDESEALEWVYGVIGSGLPVAQAVPAAFAMLMLGRADPMNCARLCANLGGDTDTVGAMACSMAGALKGKDSIPPEIREQLASVNGLDFEGTAKRMAELREITRGNN